MNGSNILFLDKILESPYNEVIDIAKSVAIERLNPIKGLI